jgi:hypothetical protein
VVRVAFFVVQDKARIAMLKGLSELTAMPAHWPGAMMGLQCDLGIVELARDPEKIKPAPINNENRQIGDSWGPDGRLIGYRKPQSGFRRQSKNLLSFRNSLESDI